MPLPSGWMTAVANCCIVVLSIIFVRTLKTAISLSAAALPARPPKTAKSNSFRCAPFNPARLSAYRIRELMHLSVSDMSLMRGITQSGSWAHRARWHESFSFFRDEDDQGNLLREFKDDTCFGDSTKTFTKMSKRHALCNSRLCRKFHLRRNPPCHRHLCLEDCRLIDPTCGSGHFWLGAYDRLFNAWVEAEPTKRHDVLAQQALTQVAGVDLIPYAVAIAFVSAHFEFLQKAEIQKLKDVRHLSQRMCGRQPFAWRQRLWRQRPKTGSAGQPILSSLEQEKRADLGKTIFTLEDSDEAERILTRGYHAVVGIRPI